MIYQPLGIKIPQEKRSEINTKIIHLINSGKCDEFGVTQADVFNLYTGIGGLHGLSRNDYDNYYDYSEAKKEIENGQFFTPHGICKFIVNCIKPSIHDQIADLTCGMGNFVNPLPNTGNFFGCEIDLNAWKVAKHLYPDAVIDHMDIRLYNPGVQFDVVLGNPPFNIKMSYEGEQVSSQMLYFMIAHKLMLPGGIICVITPSSFLSDEFFNKRDIEKIDAMFDFIVQISMDPDAFKNIGVTGYDTKVMIFRKKTEGLDVSCYSTLSAAPGISADAIYHLYVKKFKDEAARSKTVIKRSISGRRDDFRFRVEKLLFDIKRNPKLVKHYGKDYALVQKYHTQKKPDNMKYEEWDRVRLTKKKVLSHLERRVKNQHRIEKDQIRLVKTNYGLKMKGYSHKTKMMIAKLYPVKEAPFNAMEEYPFDDKSYVKLFDKKKTDKSHHSRVFRNISEEAPEAVWNFVNTFFLFHSGKRETIRLNDAQKKDVVSAISKGCGILNWKQGSGKTIAAIAWFSYFMIHTHALNVFVVSEALAINTTWKDFLTAFGIDFIQIKKLDDVKSIQPGAVVIASNSMVIKYQKFIKKHIRMQSKKVCVIIDESDEMTNHGSKRTRAYLNCFRKVRNILLTTGTTTRNNISELYAQLEIIYNNSHNMINHCDYVYEVGKDGELDEKLNPGIGKPFSAKTGSAAFKKCFNPHKVSVFGIKKHNQNIFNQEHLMDILQRTVITRTFEDIVGKKIHNVTTHRIRQSQQERDLYELILKNLVNMYQMFKRCENSRKDSLLRIIRQIQMMIKAASIPHTFKEYSGGKPGKYSKICDIIDKNPDEKIAIGTVFRETVDFYAKEFETRYFMTRPVFIADGRYDIIKRKQIIAEFEKTGNGILISTQKALKSSVNIPTCNISIIESLQWNIPRMEQYFYRFIRYDSVGEKQIIIVTYDNTIEQNILGLLMAKERVNRFVNTLEDKELGSIYDEYDIDMGILDFIISKTHDSEGRVHLSWGSQNF